MFNIKKIAATGVMALIIGGGLIGGSMQATTASANDGIRCEDDECLRLVTVATYEKSSLIYNNMLGFTMNTPVYSIYSWR